MRFPPPGAVTLGGLLGEALEANRRGRRSTFITDETSPAIALLGADRLSDDGNWYGEHAGKWLVAATRAAMREPPGGDNLRHYPSTLAAESRAFLGVDRSKRGMVLDLKRDDDRAILLNLAAEADVLVHNFRPGVPERLGIDHPTLAAINPRLVNCAVTGYGESGPLKARAGFDQVLQAMTGMSAFQGQPGQPEIIYGSPVDYYAAALVAAGVVSALYER